jgi:hypothetical protein
MVVSEPPPSMAMAFTFTPAPRTMMGVSPIAPPIVISFASRRGARCRASVQVHGVLPAHFNADLPRSR